MKDSWSFDELSDKAKQHARQTYVEQPGYPHEDWWTFDDFERVAACLGVKFKRRSEKKPRFGESSVCIHFSGFSSQGDGASFEGFYKCRPDAVQAITEYAPKDETLKRIAEGLTTMQMRVRLEFGETIDAEITTDSSRYSHSGTMRIDLSVRDNEVLADYACEATEEEEAELGGYMRSFADWMYKQLEAQYDWYFSDECVDEALGEEEFDEEGSII